MVDRENPVQAAYDRLAILKAIVGSERVRAESTPSDTRNIKLGIIEQDQPSRDVKRHIEVVFNELEILLDQMTLLHMAASFETAAKENLKNAVDATRKAVERSNKSRDRWHANLVRDAGGFRGLQDIEQVLDLSHTDSKVFAAVRRARNLFAHDVSLDKGPTIAADEARAMLSETLARMK